MSGLKPCAGGHEQLISNSVRFYQAFVNRDKKQKLIDLRGISTNWLPVTVCQGLWAQSAAVASGRASNLATSLFFFQVSDPKNSEQLISGESGAIRHSPLHPRLSHHPRQHHGQYS
jgi:hypothetical protein